MTLAIDFSSKPVGHFAGHPYWITECHPSDLVLERNYRKTYNQVALEELTIDIAKNGLCNEIMVYQRGSKLIVIDGHRRSKATKKAYRNRGKYPWGEKVELARVPIKVFVGEFTQEDILRLQISANLHEKPKAEEEAEALYALWVRARILGWSLTRFARECGITYERAKRAIVFAEEAAPELLAAVYNGELSYSALQEICKIKDQAKQREIASWAILNNKKLVREVKPRVQEVLQSYEQFELEMGLQVITPTMIKRSELMAMAREGYPFIRYVNTLVSALERGFIPKEVLTAVALEYLFKAIGLRSRLIAYLAPHDPLYQLVRGVTANCKSCPLSNSCDLEDKNVFDSRCSNECEDLVMAWFFEQLGLSLKEVADDSPEREAV